MDWSYLAQQFQSSWNSKDGFVGERGAVECRRVGGSPEEWQTRDFICGEPRFAELAVTAGRYLISSDVGLPAEIELERDDFARWCRFLQSEFPARFRMEQPIQLELSNDGIQTTQWLLRGYIRQVEQVSVSGCERLAAQVDAIGITEVDASQLTVSESEASESEIDLIEEGLSRQALKLYLFLKRGKSWTSYDTLREQRHLWQKEDVSDIGIQTALKRFQDKLGKIAPHATLTIEHESFRTKLEI